MQFQNPAQAIKWARSLIEARMDKKYQVFVSSTYEDLKDERHYVMQSLLQLNCIPSGMELFPAADDEQWELIKQVIDECDYYIVIMAGRYGSIGPAGKSYTRMEYEYALEKGKPAIGFVHAKPETIPLGKCDPENAAHLRDFQSLVQSKHCKKWESAADLGAKVLSAISFAIKTKPGIGWVRGDKLVSDSSAREILELRKELEHLKSRSENSDFASGSDKVNLKIRIGRPGESTEKEMEFGVTWDFIFDEIGDALFNGQNNAETLARHLSGGIAHANLKALGIAGLHELTSIAMETQEMMKVIHQFRALRWIEKPDPKMNLWKLSEKGEEKFFALRAQKKEKPGAGEADRAG